MKHSEKFLAPLAGVDYNFLIKIQQDTTATMAKRTVRRGLIEFYLDIYIHIYIEYIYIEGSLLNKGLTKCSCL